MTTTKQMITVDALQRGRAEIDFLGAVSSYANGALRDRVRQVFEEKTAGRQIPKEFDERLSTIQEFMDPTPEWQFDQLYARMCAEELAPTAVRAGVERHGAEPAAEEVPLLVPVDPDVELPDYWDGVNFHVSPFYTDQPKWSFTGNYGVIAKVFNRAGVAAVPKGSNIFEQRKLAVDQATVTDPEKVLDIGTGGGGAFLNTIADRYPDAEIHGVDLSASGLSSALAMGRAVGREYVLSHQNGESLSYGDETFDLVTSYALFHETPDSAAKNILAEAFRVLKPGGQIVMVDVPPYREIGDLQFLYYDWETEGRVEPHWRAACQLNRGDVCREIGYVDVEEYGFGETKYPWVLRASKPN